MTMTKDEEVKDTALGELPEKAWETKQDALGDPTETSDFAMSLMAHRFTDASTMHGLRYIFMRDAHLLRRFLWLLVVCGGISYCMIVVYQSVLLFYSFPRTARVSTIFESKSEFPAVTMCAYNVFQKSKLSEKQATALQQVYQNIVYIPAKNPVNLSSFDNMDVNEFFRNTSYPFHSANCVYRQAPCNKSVLISERFTDYGICLEFDPSGTVDLKYQTAAGHIGGFDFFDFVNESEWSFGPYMFYSGFRIAIHHSSQKIYYLRDKGFSLLPGFTTEVAISRKVYSLLKPPHGQCGSTELRFFDVYSRELCLVECETNHTVAVCGCRFPYMPGDAPICSLAQMRRCNFALNNPLDQTHQFDQTQCSCPQECVYSEFETVVTAISEGWINVLNQTYGLNLRNGFQLKVYYQDLQYTETTEEPLYGWERLICDIGGAAGLFLGCSFVTMVEFVDFFGELMWNLGLRSHVKSKRDGKVIAMVPAGGTSLKGRLNNSIGSIWNSNRPSSPMT